MSSPVLTVDSLRVDVPAGVESVTLVDDISFSLAAGERMALVGESGSGKSVTARALLRLDPYLRTSGSIVVGGHELVGASEATLRRVRGRTISMIFQDPLSALGPLMTIGAQVAAPLIAHGAAPRIARARAAALLGDLGIASSGQRMRAYPHELSGGMRQRVVMAIALICEPAILVADEPTTALDVRIQAQVLSLIGDVVRERGLALLLVTHDFGVVAETADRVSVMYSGRLVESGSAQTVMSQPLHPYTRGLLQAVPSIDGPRRRLVALGGTPPAPVGRPAGCAFHPRCAVAVPACESVRPVLLPVDSDRAVACHRVHATIEVRS